MPRDVRSAIIASLSCALLLLPVVVGAYGVGPGERLDASIFNRLAAHDSGAVHAISTGVVALGDLLPLVAMLALLVAVGLAFGRTRQAIAAAAIVAGAGLTTQILKQLLAHPRLQEQLVGTGHPWPDSFPSG